MVDQAPEARLAIEVTCGKCGKAPTPEHPLMLEMEPGAGETETWHMCVGCWLGWYQHFDAPRPSDTGRVAEVVVDT